MWEILNLGIKSVPFHGHEDERGDGDDEDLVPGTLGPGGGGVKQAMQAATARRMSRMQTFFNIIFSLHFRYFSNIVFNFFKCKRPLLEE